MTALQNSFVEENKNIYFYNYYILFKYHVKKVKRKMPKNNQVIGTRKIIHKQLAMTEKLEEF